MTQSLASIARTAAVSAVVTSVLVASGVVSTVEKKTPTAAIRAEKIAEWKTTSGSSVFATGSGNLVLSGTLLSDRTNDFGWNVKAGADAACSTTCTHACVFGVNTAATEADIVGCQDATADECLCAGPN